MKVLHHRLKAKGWTDKEIKNLKKIMKRADEKKSLGVFFSERIVYWIALALTIIATFFFSLILIPLIMGASTGFVYLTTLLMGICFGALFVVILKDIEHLSAKHHIAQSIILPLTAVVNIVLIVNLANRLVRDTNIGQTQSYIGISIVYVVALLAPYILFLIKKRDEKHVTHRLEH
jgi:hypothetical protein